MNLLPDPNEPYFSYGPFSFYNKEDLPLFTTKCYLSGPIDYAKDSGVGWRKQITPHLLLMGIEVYDPTSDPKQTKSGTCHKLLAEKKYDEATKIIRDFVRKDLILIDHASFIIVKITPGVVTTGTVQEVVNATNRHIPVIMFCDEGKNKIPAWYYGIVPHRYFFSSENEVLNYLQEVNEGKHQSDRRWAYVYGLL